MAGSPSPAIVPTDAPLMSTALATRCPHCHTYFRVTPQQLALRDGMVRCGACREIFNGEVYVFERTELTEATASAHVEDDTTGRMTLIDFGSLRATPAPRESNMQEELDALSKAIADLQSKPWTETAPVELSPAEEEEDTEQPAPGFVHEARQRQRTSRAWTFLLIVGIPLLLGALTAQLGYLFRNDIAARSPEAARYMRAVCRRVGCTITLPAQIEALSIESRHLQKLQDQDNHFELIILVRNIGTTSQAWPALDLQLNNATGQTEIRKIFMPSEFLKASEIRAGIPAASEREVRLRFELNGNPAHGFNIQIFYP
jgi:predicted Zn finger-like uncharacterized protein